MEISSPQAPRDGRPHRRYGQAPAQHAEAPSGESSPPRRGGLQRRRGGAARPAPAARPARPVGIAARAIGRFSCHSCHSSLRSSGGPAPPSRPSARDPTPPAGGAARLASSAPDRHTRCDARVVSGVKVVDCPGWCYVAARADRGRVRRGVLPGTGPTSDGRPRLGAEDPSRPRRAGCRGRVPPPSPGRPWPTVH